MNAELNLASSQANADFGAVIKLRQAPGCQRSTPEQEQESGVIECPKSGVEKTEEATTEYKEKTMPLPRSEPSPRLKTWLRALSLGANALRRIAPGEFI